MTTKTKTAPAHVNRPATTHSNGRAPAKPRPASDRFLYEGLKAERRRMYAASAQSAQAAHQPICAATATGTYKGAELQPYQGRPGALDFLRLPSLMGSRRVYRQEAPEAAKK